MIILQAFWEIDNGLHLWAESSEVRSSPSRSRNKIGTQRSHPFSLPARSLIAAAASLSVNLDLDETDAAQLSVLLPSTGQSPLPSEECLGLNPDETRKAEPVRLAPWQLETLKITPAAALDYLSTLENHPPAGIVFAHSLRFWVEMSKLALELVARQCFLPSVKKVNQEGALCYEALWEVVIEGRDEERTKQLIESMPPSCRSIQYAENPSPAPPVVGRNFLNRTVDIFIRRSLDLHPQAFSGLKSPQISASARQWFCALYSANHQIKSQSHQTNDLVQALDAWLISVKGGPSSTPLRTSFRLEPPEEGERNWNITFHLQASQDHSLLIPAEKVWRTRSSEITFLKQRFENPQERLLADLGKASRIYPPIEESLKDACPSGLKLDTEEAYRFLRQQAGLLEQTGFGVLLPAWWQKPAARLGTKLKLKPRAGTKGPGSGLLGLNSIVAYEWELALGETTLSRQEFERLAELKVPLVKIRGQWVEIKPEDIEKALAFYQKGEQGEMTLGEAIRAGLETPDREAGLTVTDVSAEGWVKKFMDTFKGAASGLPAIKPPDDFRGQLRPYQITGVSWMAYLRQFGLGACLADDMGLGKTIEFISLLLYLKGKQQLSGPSLLICPMSVVNNWKREVEHFAPSLRIMVHHGPQRETGENLLGQVKLQDIVVTSYALAHRDAPALSKIEWECLVLDEAQNIKNHSAKQSQAVRKLNGRCRIALTGTPVENRLSELWSIMDFLNPGYLKSAQDFQTGFVTPIEKHRSPQHSARLKQLIQPFILRRLKTDPSIISDLPNKIETKVFCNLTKEQATLYQAVVKEMLEKIDGSKGIERKGLVLATLLKLKQVCNHPAQFLQDQSGLRERSGKLLRLDAMLEEILAEGDKALIFTQFAEMGRMLKGYLQETYARPVLFLHGGTPRQERDGMIQRFQNETTGPALFILSLKAGGVGLNLTAANHVFHFDRWWNPAVENQATDRAFRIGQKKNVQVHKFVCLGTVEERIDQMIEKKKELAENIVGAGEAWLTEMSNEQLKAIFVLSREAVEN